MLLELAQLFLDIRFVLMIILFFIYYFINAKALYQCVAIFLMISIFGRSIHSELLNMENAQYFWYITWTSLTLFSLFIVMKITGKNPHIQKMTIPISILMVIDIFIGISRHLERNITGTNYFKELYGLGIPTINWLVVGFLFAPIALLLVKSLREKLETKH